MIDKPGIHLNPAGEIVIRDCTIGGEGAFRPTSNGWAVENLLITCHGNKFAEADAYGLDADTR